MNRAFAVAASPRSAVAKPISPSALCLCGAMLLACGGKTNDTIQPASAGADSGSSGQGGAAGNAGWYGGLAGKDAGGDSSCTPTVPAPSETPSRQSVTFQITNLSDSPKYVGGNGYKCDSYVIRQDAALVPRTLFWEPPCEPGGWQEWNVVRAWSIAAHSTREFVWDARTMVTYTKCVDCSLYGWPGTGTVTAAVSRPVPAGTYEVTFGLDTQPAGCDQYDGSCPILGHCPSVYEVSTSFELPEIGDIIVPITLPAFEDAGAADASGGDALPDARDDAE